MFLSHLEPILLNDSNMFVCKRLYWKRFSRIKLQNVTVYSIFLTHILSLISCCQERTISEPMFYLFTPSSPNRMSSALFLFQQALPLELHILRLLSGYWLHMDSRETPVSDLRWQPSTAASEREFMPPSTYTLCCDMALPVSHGPPVTRVMGDGETPGFVI